MRWAQLTLVEDDPGKFDPQFWLDYFRRTHSDAACLSAGGCVAYYPTKVPFHHRSAWLGDRDPFGDLVAGCRKLGMVVIARTDPHATYDDVDAAHPDWIAVDAAGQKRRHWASPEMWVTCALGPYNFDVHDRGPPRDHDAISRRRHLHQSLVGLGHVLLRALPRQLQGGVGPRPAPDQRPRAIRSAAPSSSGSKSDCSTLWRLWDAEVRKINRRLVRDPEHRRRRDQLDGHEAIGELAPILFADRQGRSGLTAPWASGKNAKEYRATMGRKPIGGIFSVGVEEAYRWKDSVQSPAEIRIWVADGIANGLHPWFTKFSGTLYDRRWLGVVEDIYRWHHRVEKYLRNEAPLARVGLVYSQQTAWFHDGPKPGHAHRRPHPGLVPGARRGPHPVRDGARPAARRGAPAPVQDPDPARRRRAFRRAMQAALARLSTAAAAWWRRTRPRSATSGEPSARTSGSRTSSASRTGHMPRDRCGTRTSRLEVDPRTNQPPSRSSAGLDGTTRIINGTYRLDVEARRPFGQPPLTLIPSYPDLPMEKVYPRVARTEIPQVYLREIGAGRVVYFPWDIDRVFWELLCCRPRIADAQRRALGDQRRAPRPGHRPGRARRHALASEGVDHRAPGQPDQPHDDERALPRARRRRSARGRRPLAGRAARPAGCSCWWPTGP